MEENTQEQQEKVVPSNIGSRISRKTRRKAERFLKKNERKIDLIYEKELDELDFDYKKEGTKYFFPDEETIAKATEIRKSISFQYLADHFDGLQIKESQKPESTPDV